MAQKTTNQPKSKIKKWVHENYGTLVLLVFVFGYLAYQKVPLYLKDQEYLKKPAPDFALSRINGDVVRLSDLKGKKVLINFWATWCVPCRVELPGLRAMYEDLEGENFEFLAIASEDRRRVESFLQEYPMNYPVLLDPDGRVANQFDVRVYPSFVFINEEGLIEEIDHGMNLFMRWKMLWKVKGTLW